MRALVAGGAGFIGSALVDRLLAEDHEVDVLDDLSSGAVANLADARAEASGRLKIQQIDLADEATPAVIERRRPDVVFHLALPSPPGGGVDDPSDDAHRTVLGTVRLLEGARRAGTRKVVVAVSASDLYSTGDVPSFEDDSMVVTTPAGAARRAVLDYLGVFSARHDVRFTALAMTSVYGPRQRRDGEGGVLARFIDACRAGEACPIDGDGEQTRDFVFVDDVVDACVRAVDRADGLVVNVGSGMAISVNEAAALAAALTGADLSIEHRPPRPVSTPHTCVDIGRAAIQLGWRPFTDLPEGLRQL